MRKWWSLLTHNVLGIVGSLQFNHSWLSGLVISTNQAVYCKCGKIIATMLTDIPPFNQLVPLDNPHYTLRFFSSRGGSSLIMNWFVKLGIGECVMRSGYNAMLVSRWSPSDPRWLFRFVMHRFRPWLHPIWIYAMQPRAFCLTITAASNRSALMHNEIISEVAFAKMYFF